MKGVLRAPSRAFAEKEVFSTPPKGNSMTTDLVQLSYKGPVATIVLNRADKLNALNAEMLTALEAYADELDRNHDVRVVLLAGTGRAFCVGADIYEWSDLSPLEMGRRWIRDGHRIFARYARLPQPVIRRSQRLHIRRRPRTGPRRRPAPRRRGRRTLFP